MMPVILREIVQHGHPRRRVHREDVAASPTVLRRTPLPLWPVVVDQRGLATLAEFHPPSTQIFPRKWRLPESRQRQQQQTNRAMHCVPFLHPLPPRGRRRLAHRALRPPPGTVVSKTTPPGIAAHSAPPDISARTPQKAPAPPPATRPDQSARCPGTSACCAPGMQLDAARRTAPPSSPVSWPHRPTDSACGTLRDP